jgi:hypothetical protein
MPGAAPGSATQRDSFHITGHPEGDRIAHLAFAARLLQGYAPSLKTVNHHHPTHSLFQPQR